MPPGDYKNLYDFQAMYSFFFFCWKCQHNSWNFSNMAAAHNTFIRGFNSITHHAPTVKGDKVKPFIFFCLTLVRRGPTPLILILFFFLLAFFQLDGIHHHHILEETYYFPEMEKKLGEGALQGNVEEHKEFVPGLEVLDEWCKKVQKGEVEYDSKVFLELVDAFGDTMVAHLHSVRSCSTLPSFCSTDSRPPSIALLSIGNPNFGP